MPACKGHARRQLSVMRACRDEFNLTAIPGQPVLVASLAEAYQKAVDGMSPDGERLPPSGCCMSTSGPCDA